MADLVDGMETVVNNETIQNAEHSGEPSRTQTQTPSSDNDWRNSLPEDLRGNESLGKFKTTGDLVKSYLNMEKLIGRKTIGLPDENSSEEDWGKFFDRLGRPESPDKYQIRRAEGIPPELIDEKGTKAFLAVAHKAGLSQKQVAALFEEYDRQLGEGIKAKTSQEEAKKDAVLMELRNLWGRDLQAKVERAEQTLGIIDPENRIDREKLKNNVQVIQLLNQFSEKVLGDSLPKEQENGGITDIEDRITVLRNSPAFANEMHMDHDKVMTEYKMLMQKRNMIQRKA